MAPIGTLYGVTFQPKTLRVLAIAKYAGLDLTYTEVNPLEGEHQKPEYKNKFPHGKVPGFEGADGFLLHESRAILPYVAGLAPNGASLLGTDAKSAALVTAWVNWADDEIFDQAAGLFRLSRGAYPYSKPLETYHVEQLNRALAYLDSQLQTRTFLVGHRLTVADITVGTALRSLYGRVFGPEVRSKYPNTVRYLNTVINQPALGDVLTKDFAFATESAKFQPAKKEEKPKAAAPAAAPATKKEKKPKDDEEEEEPLVPAEPKTKNPLDDLPKSPFILDEWKRQYSNKDTRGEALPWFWENFDAQGWSLWKFDFKYNDELTQIFMSANQIGGFFNRLEASRKYVFGTAGVFGEANNSVISGVALCRGHDWKPVLGVAPDIDSYNVTPLDPTKAEDKKLWDDFLAWEVSVDGKAWADGKVLK
ncbi:hypothetical protein OC846_006287 [Tilletia horrida]|uniref:Elongation factor 1-gamma n=1 Tax=Tilletia horrida TaxID=155126 RepID=A0AAN6GJ57_9BASI|nr:hypothetical protein OC845_006291 [Tilletia horrida]KAK0543792.1 hypothetical protein OC846_006287 [Tilletia horrida]